MHSPLVRCECPCRCIYIRITHRYLSRRRAVVDCIRRRNAVAYRRHSSKWREGNHGGGIAGHINNSGCILHWLLRVFLMKHAVIFCKRMCNVYFKNEVILKHKIMSHAVYLCFCKINTLTDTQHSSW